MKLTDFLHDKIPYLMIHLFVMLFLAMFLYVLKLGAYAIFFAVGTYFFAASSVLAIEFLTKRGFYADVKRDLDSLDHKSMLSEMIEEPEFFEGRFLYDALKQTGKSQNDEISACRRTADEYREYIELWMHEVKTPLASARLTIENNKNGATRRIAGDLDEVERLLEQALYYSRLETAEKDYIVRQVSLEELVNSTLRKNARLFISNGVSVDCAGLEGTVLTDPKWCDFILSQLFVNAVKYRRQDGGAKVSVRAAHGANGTTLYVSDNGIGIRARDLPRVFDKGFTGETGRRYAKSTGMGLYLCKKLCDALSIGIGIDSEEGAGTSVRLTFPCGSLTDLTKL